jgi:hypothetical protein
MRKGKEVASMRRVISLFTVVTVMTTLLTAGPVLAQIVDIPPPGEDIPGNQQSPEDNPEPKGEGQGRPDTILREDSPAQNCYGNSQFEGFSGPGTEFPGSAADPADFDIDATGPRPTQDFFSGPAHKEFLLAEDLQDPTDTTPGGGNNISNLQQDARKDLAACP